MRQILIILLLALSVTATAQTIDEIKEMPADEGLFYAMEYYGIMEPHIVYAQAVLETGHFKSDLCRKHGNLFGLYDSRRHAYCHFGHWIESVVAYRDRVQSKYKGGDYYYFLDALPYALDPEYTKKVRIIAENYIEYE